MSTGLQAAFLHKPAQQQNCEQGKIGLVFLSFINESLSIFHVDSSLPKLLLGAKINCLRDTLL